MYNEAMSAPLELHTVKELVNNTLSDLLRLRRSEAMAMDVSYGALWEAISETVLAGGKRIRPFLVAVGSGQLDVSTLKIACAFELLHVAMLMHDDVIDRDTMRHGHATINGRYHAKYIQHTDDTTARHHAGSAGILAGDVLLSEAFYLLAEAELEPAAYRRVLEVFHRAVFDVAGGELLDVEAGFMAGCDPMTIAKYKTAVYSFVAPLSSGAYCRNAAESEVSLLRDFGLHAGIAFQLQDDVIGLFGDEEKSGKSTSSDLHEGKRTALVAAFLRRASTETRQAFEQHFGSETASDQEIAAMKNAIADSGAFEEIVTLYEEYLAKADAVVARLEDDTLRQQLINLTAMLRRRAA